MEFSLKESLLRPFKDNKYFEKIIIGGGFYLIALVLYATNFFTNCMNLPQYDGQNMQKAFMLGFKHGLVCTYSTPSGLFFHFISFLLLAIPLGYVAYYVHNYIHGEEDILPKWKNNIFSFFKKGLSLYLLTFCYLIIMSIVIIITVVIFSILNGILGIIPRMQLPFFGVIIGSIIQLIFTSFAPYILSLYAENFKLAQGFKIFSVFKYVSRAFDKFLICVIVCGLVYLVYMVIKFVLVITIIGAPVACFAILPVILSLVTPFVNIYIIVKGKENINKDKTTPSAKMDAFDISKTI
jgi:hypothetical protein